MSTLHALSMVAIASAASLGQRRGPNGAQLRAWAHLMTLMLRGEMTSVRGSSSVEPSKWGM